MKTLQSISAVTALYCNAAAALLGTAVIAEEMAAGNPDADMDSIDAIIEVLVIHSISCLGLANVCKIADSFLFDITPHEEAQPLQYARSKQLRINHLSDPAAHKMTHFFVDHLQCLYNEFDLVGFLANQNNGLGDEMMSFYTGFYVGNTACQYRIHPEEVFLFTLTKLATGRSNASIVDEYFGGDYARWSYAFPAMLEYLDHRYQDIIAHQGIVRFVNEFPHFNEQIEKFC